MNNISCEMIDCLTDHLDSLSSDLEGDLALDNAAVRVTAIPDVLTKIQETTSDHFLTEYSEYFESVKVFYGNCGDIHFLDDNLQRAYDSIVLLSACLKQIKEQIVAESGKCTCCGGEVNYLPLSKRYADMAH